MRNIDPRDQMDAKQIKQLTVKGRLLLNQLIDELEMDYDSKSAKTYSQISMCFAIIEHYIEHYIEEGGE